MSHESNKAELGILFVHGIGSHGRGVTLSNFAQPILNWLAAWFGSSNRKGDDISESGSLVNEPAALCPAHYTVQVGAESEREHNTWLLCESNWDEIVSTPPAAKVASWGLRVWPWVFWSHVLPILHRNRWRLVTVAITFAILAFLAVLVRRYPLTVFFNIILSPFLAVAFFAAVWPVFRFVVFITLLSISLITHRIPALHKLVGLHWLQGTLAEVIGDSYALVGPKSQEHELVRRVQSDIGWLAKRSRRVAIIAHSQGGAISHEAIRTGQNEIDLLITLGSGLNKLTKLRKLEHLTRTAGARYQLIPWFGLMAPILAIVVVTILDSYTGGYLWQEPWRYIWRSLIAIAFVTMLGTGIWMAIQLRPSGNAYRLDKAHTWVDYFASHDPISNGRLDDREGNAESSKVYNECSVILDHTAYWKNIDGFVGPIAWRLAELSKSYDGSKIADTREVLRVATQRRKFRYSVLLVSKWLTRLAAACMILPGWAISPNLDLFPLRFFGIVNSFNGRITYSLTVIIAALLVNVVGRLFKTKWDEIDINVFLRRKRYGLPWPFWGLVVLGLALAVIIDQYFLYAMAALTDLDD